MTNAPLSPTRRAVLRTIATIVALAALAVLAGCGTSTTPTPGAMAGGVAPSTLVMVIRHGKKPGPDDRFDVVWTLAKTADGWHFAQTPELTLPRTRPASSKNDHQPLPGDSRSNGRDDHHTA